MPKLTTNERHKRRRMEAVKAQGGRCIYCAVMLTFHYSNGQPCQTDATFEHLTPKSAGGRDTRSNRAASCYNCNHERGTTPHFRFLKKKAHMRKAKLTLFEKA